MAVENRIPQFNHVEHPAFSGEKGVGVVMNGTLFHLECVPSEEGKVLDFAFHKHDPYVGRICSVCDNVI